MASRLVCTGIAAITAAALECVLVGPAFAACPEPFFLVVTIVAALGAVALFVPVVDAGIVVVSSAAGGTPWDSALRDLVRVRLGGARRAPGSAEDRRLALEILLVVGRAVLVAAAAGGAVLWAADRFRSPLAIGVVAGGAAAAAVLLGWTLARRAALPLARFAGRGRHRGGSAVATLVIATLAVAVVALAVVVLASRPSVADDLRVRTALVLTALLSTYVVARIAWRPVEGSMPPRRTAALVLSLVLGLATLGIGWTGPRVRQEVVVSGLVSGLVAEVVRVATDFDGDGSGMGLGGGDCAPWDPAIHPDAEDVPENGRDENCTGSDAVSLDLAGAARRSHWNLPAGFPRDLSFVLLVVDSIRADALGLSGYARRITPRMDRFARENAYFADAWANNPGTHGSFRSLQTSLFPRAVPMDDFVRGMGNPIRPEARTIAELMKEAGLFTSAIHSFRYFTRGTGFEQGFDRYDTQAAARGTLRGITAPILLRKVEAEIRRLGRERFFLFVHVLDPHHEYVIHEGYPFFGRNRRNRYDNEVAFTDDYVGRMLDAIERGPQGDKTFIVLASDHGEAFREHGVVYHNTTVYQEMLRVPIVVRLPPAVPAARPRRLEAPVSLVDIVPTLLNAVGRRPPRSAVGHSLLAAAAVGREDFSRIVYSETTDTQLPSRRLRRVTSDTHALVHDATAGRFELFDRRRDPGEHSPLGGTGGSEGERLRMALEAFESETSRADSDNKRRWRGQRRRRR